MRLATHVTPPRRRFVDKAPRSRAFDAVHRVADKFYQPLRRLFEQAWTAVQETVDWEEVSTALTQGNLPAVLVLLEQGWAESADRHLRDQLRTLMTQMVKQSAVASQPALTTLLRPTVAITFDAASPLVLDYVRNHSGELIQGIGRETRQAIRAMLVQNMEAGRSWRSLVPEMQQMIGVTVKQADALVARRRLLESQGMRPAQIDKLIEQKTRQYKRLRARTIARHEGMMAASFGAQAQVNELIAQGVLEPSRYKKYYILTNDDRLCPICRETKQLNRDGVGVLEPFQTPNGPHIRPPIHILCRCAATIRAVRSLP